MKTLAQHQLLLRPAQGRSVILKTHFRRAAGLKSSLMGKIPTLKNQELSMEYIVGLMILYVLKCLIHLSSCLIETDHGQDGGS